MPCAHIVAHALSVKKKIPLRSFHPRFYMRSSNALRDTADNIDDDNNDDNDHDRHEDEDDDPDDEGSDDGHRDEDVVEELCEDTVPTTVCNLILTDRNEVRFYQSLFDSAATLVRLYALPEWKDKANKMEQWLSPASDGLVIGCVKNCYQSSFENEIIMDHIKITETLCRASSYSHISDANLDSIFPDAEISAFRGRLRAVVIKIILVRRICVDSAKCFAEEFKKRVSALLTESINRPSSREACLRPVYGTLHMNSYITVKRDVAKYCRDALLASGFHLSALINASKKVADSKKAAASKKAAKIQRSLSSSSCSDIGPRIRRKIL